MQLPLFQNQQPRQLVSISLEKTGSTTATTGSERTFSDCCAAIISPAYDSAWVVTELAPLAFLSTVAAETIEDDPQLKTSFSKEQGNLKVTFGGIRLKSLLDSDSRTDLQAVAENSLQLPVLNPDLLDATPSLQLPFLPSIPTTTCPLGFVILTYQFHGKKDHTCQFHGKKDQRELLEQLTEKAERRLILVMSLAKIFFWSLEKLKGKDKLPAGPGPEESLSSPLEGRFWKEDLFARCLMRNLTYLMISSVL
ncbi:hypothetical protein Anapl_16226 [Anas platyrhynchos]|uniref:Uncharacterized protein n=1 Tax=Anas platyrhynchos TaxID=8839 RepID=R0KLH2_ANAPL|nr:hypothetical protein Anapl_16226 [Anas platyrhynchos]